MTHKVDPELKPVLSLLGSRPGAQAVEAAKQALARIDSQISANGVGELPMAKIEALQEAAEKEKLPYLAVIQLEMLHQSYEDLLKKSSNTPSSLPNSESIDLAVELEKTIASASTEKLEHFEFCGKELKNISRSLMSITCLSSLNLSNNQLEVVPSEIGDLVNLVALNVHSNKLKSLPESIGNLSKLKILNVSGNLLKALPENLSSCSELVELNANFNQLETWMPVFGWKLVKLRKLEFQFNNLVGLPESFGHLKELKHLDLRNNHLRGLPLSIGSLSHLETLDLSRNFSNLCTLPDTIGNLASLLTLDLSFNQIRELPPALGKLKNLKNLMLDQNPLVVPPKRVIEHSQEAVLAYLLDLLENGVESKQSAVGQIRKKVSPRSPGRASVACLMIPGNPRHDHAGGWVPVRPGNTWMRSFLGQFMCGGLMGGNTLRWQEHHSDDDY